ncbi:vitellogenin-1-like [Chironomus tepperi]|uniref:vitellogenin-1-like n=1 Tax=Chironomus tepperi TaxID=113505 RepID=UPI00391F964A
MKTSIMLIYSAATIVLLHQYVVVATPGSFTDKISDVGRLGVKAGSGIIKKVPDLIPTPENLYTVSKQTLIGLPFELLLSGIDKLCSIALAAGNSTESFKQPKNEEINYVLLTENENVSIPVTDSVRLWAHEKFDPSKKVVVMITGWNSDIDSENTAADELWKAYKSRGDTNFILIDTARYVDTLYAWSAFNTQELGKAVGKGLAELINYVPLENIHVMGHSLGAHIAGSAGKTFQHETDKLLPRITAFDPAKPCFGEGESLQGVGRGDAEFVDVIHSDAGGLGKPEAIGDADFFPNGIVPLMPGCFTIFCSHSRAWEYYAETVYKGNENNFIAKKCGSLHSFEINACIRQEVAMGYSCPKTVKGNFFLKTKSKFPFGLSKREE